MKGLIIGATGATGKDLLAKLLEDEAFSEIKRELRNILTFSTI